MIDVSVLGSFDVRDEARGSLATLIAQPRRAALLAYLVVEGGGDFVGRDALLALFWPHADETRARASLRQALVFLRRALGEAALVRRGDDAIAVDRAAIRCDLWRFREALGAGRDSDAVDLYRGPLLDGIVLSDSPDLEQWCASQRLSTSHAASGAAARVADAASRTGDLPRALRFARVAQQLEPYDELHHRRILRLLDGAGDRATAIREHATFVAMLRRELDVDPSPETLALAESLRAPSLEAPPTIPPPAPSSVELPAPAVQGGARPSLPASRRLVWWGGAAVVATITATLWLTRPAGERAPAPPLSTRRVVVLPLVEGNSPEERSALGMMVADWVTEGLSRIDGIEVVPATALIASRRTLDSAANGGTPPARPTNAGDAWRAAATDLGAGVVVHGTAYRTTDSLHLHAQVVETSTGRLLRPAVRVSVPAASTMDGIHQLRGRIVATMAPWADTVTHLRQAISPPSYEAYHDYVTGLESFVQGDPRAALALFSRSAAADPSYPMPRIAAAIMHLNLNEADSAAALLAPLQVERSLLGPLEQGTLDMVAGLLYGDLPKAYDAVVRQARIAPGTIGEYMVAELARRMNRPVEAVHVLRQLGPDRGELRGWRAYWRELTFALHLLGDHASELKAARDALRRYPGDVSIAAYEVRALASMGELIGVRQGLARLDALPATPAQRGSARLLAATELLRHHPPDGRTMAAEVVAWFDSLPAGVRDQPTLQRLEGRALLLAERARDARHRLRPLVGSGTPSLELAGLMGAAAAADGDRAEALRWMSVLEKQTARLSDAARGLSWGEGPYRRAIIAAHLADSVTALSLLSEARRAGLPMDPTLHAEPAFATLRRWPPFAALVTARDGGQETGDGR